MKGIPKKNNTKKYTTIDSKLSSELGFKCLVCETTIKLSEVKQMCDECLDALKALILEKRVNPKK